MPPGKISITYDDAKHTKTTAYSSQEGTLSSTLIYDSVGATIGESVLTAGRSLDVKIQCTYDSQNNWTSCQQFLEKAGASTVAKEWRRKITYR